MGAMVSCACCGEAEATELEVPLSPGASPRADGRGGEKPPQFFAAALAGLPVSLILQDKSRMDCRVRINEGRDSIVLLCDNKVRTIALVNIKSLLHTPQQLQRVDYSAGISGADHCVAVHILETGNCIPLFFHDEDSKSYFVAVVEALVSQIQHQ
eukprot:GHVT01009061.1.p1 GENE.GHVT01009061.1~~GHVT01009061.1.p1  ORF type:complete len:155 (+),score=27.94 GHVT01009061.1:500-964(+)